MAPAKLNLGLAVGPARADGFHELATVFQSISLADTLELRPRRAGFVLRVTIEDPAARGRGVRRVDVPANGSNLVVRAARLAQAHLGVTTGAELRLTKRIPARAGLGGGSADAAAALLGFLALHRARVPRATLATLAARLGSDVPFALAGGTAIGRGRGERLHHVAAIAPFRAVIAVPRWSIATPRAYRAVDRLRNHLTAWRSNLRFAQVLEHERFSAERAMRMGNTFESVLGSRRRDFDRVRAALEDAGATAVRMTGSGSAVVGVLPHGCPSTTAVRRYQGREALYLVRSAQRGTRIITRA